MMFGFARNIARNVEVESKYKMQIKRHIRVGLCLLETPKVSVVETHTPRHGEMSTICLYFDYSDS